MLTLVIPVYRNEGSIHELLAAINKLNQDMSDTLEAVFVIDGSPDRCYEILHDALPAQPYSSQLILLSRNFGSFAAIRVGLAAGNGENFAVMAADLQEPPELVIRMNDLLLEGDADIVVAVREGRNDPLMTRLPAAMFWGLYRRFVVPEMPPGGVDIFACNLAFRNQLLQLDEQHSSLIAQIFWLGFRRKFIGYERQKRRHGKSAWTLHKKINYLMDSVFSFTDLPIRLLIRIGAAATLISGLFGLIVALARALGYIDVPGYAAIIVTIIFFGALNLLGLGIVGDYAWRAYENTKGRPLAVELRAERFGTQEPLSKKAGLN